MSRTVIPPFRPTPPRAPTRALLIAPTFLLAAAALAHPPSATAPGMPDFGRVSLIDASAFDAGKAYVSARLPLLDDFRPHVWRTDDHGETWTRIVDGIRDDAYVNSVREDPNREGLLYAGTNHGVYVTYDDGGSWQELNPWITDVTDEDLAAQYEFGVRVRDQVDRANRAVIEIRRVKGELAERLDGLDDDETLMAAAERLRAALDGIEGEIYQVRNRSNQDLLNFPIEVNNRLANLLSMPERGDGRPGSGMYEVFEIMVGRLEGLLGALEGVWEGEVGEVKEALEGVWGGDGGALRRSYLGGNYCMMVMCKSLLKIFIAERVEQEMHP